MIEGISHITFVMKNIDKTSQLLKELLDAHEVYYSAGKNHSLFNERFFIIGNQWIAIMEDTNILNRTYHHIAFKISDSESDRYLEKMKALNLELLTPRKRVSGEGYSIYFYDYDNNLFRASYRNINKKIIFVC